MDLTGVNALQGVAREQSGVEDAQNVRRDDADFSRNFANDIEQRKTIAERRHETARAFDQQWFVVRGNFFYGSDRLRRRDDAIFVAGGDVGRDWFGEMNGFTSSKVRLAV